jgi:hypothetical protein
MGPPGTQEALMCIRPAFPAIRNAIVVFKSTTLPNFSTDVSNPLENNNNITSGEEKGRENHMRKAK